jgi:hypothetical protein
MGNVPDRSKGSTIFIQLDNDKVQSGTCVKGIVHVELKQSYLTEALTLQFEGFEKISRQKNFIVNTTI